MTAGEVERQFGVSCGRGDGDAVMKKALNPPFREETRNPDAKDGGLDDAHALHDGIERCRDDRLIRRKLANMKGG